METSKSAAERLCVQLSRDDADATSRTMRLRLRRIFLIGAAIIPVLAVMDVFLVPPRYRATALMLRAIMAVSNVVLGLAIPRASALGLRLILATAAGLTIVLLTLLFAVAGSSAQYFQYLVAMPMCVAVCLPVEMLAAVVATVASLGCGVGLMLWEGGNSGASIMRWATLCVMSGGMAMFACHTYKRLHEAQRRAALEREEDLKRLAAVVAHEINNQLGILQNTISLSAKNAVDASIVALQQESVNQMRELTSDFLRYGVSGAERQEAVDLVHLTHAYAQAFAPHVEVSSAADRAVVVGDRTRIARALLNVLKNGVEAGAPVHVTVDEKGDGVRVRVTDRGPGVSPEVARRIGEPFFTTKARGTGLGLALVKQVVSEHYGRFTMYNRTEGGVLAELWFPRSLPERLLARVASSARG